MFHTMFAQLKYYPPEDWDHILNIYGVFPMVANTHSIDKYKRTQYILYQMNKEILKHSTV